ncbi:MAG: hypothetical protein JKY51_11210 [Opitutaceae bacterium]|nr:hypothetical protein [Opitutaceae bacterium]
MEKKGQLAVLWASWQRTNQIIPMFPKPFSETDERKFSAKHFLAATPLP